MQSFRSTTHSSHIIVTVSHSPSMRYARENFDGVLYLWSKMKTIEN
jgi:hypothetical protein